MSAKRQRTAAGPSSSKDGRGEARYFHKVPKAYHPKIPRMLTQVASGTGSERKWIDINFNSYNISNAAALIVLLNGNIPGFTTVTHVGRKLVMKSIQLRGEVTMSAPQAGTTYGRVVLVYDKQADGAAPTWASVYSSTNAAGTVDSSALAMRNLDTRDRYVVISDRSFSLGPLVTGATLSYATSPQSFCVDIYKKINMDVIFNAGTAGTVADINTGSLHLMCFIDTAATQVIDFSSRIRFDDK